LEGVCCVLSPLRMYCLPEEPSLFSFTRLWVGCILFVVRVGLLTVSNFFPFFTLSKCACCGFGCFWADMVWFFPFPQSHAILHPRRPFFLFFPIFWRARFTSHTFSQPVSSPTCDCSSGVYLSLFCFRVLPAFFLLRAHLLPPVPFSLP